MRSCMYSQGYSPGSVLPALRPTLSDLVSPARRLPIPKPVLPIKDAGFLRHPQHLWCLTTSSLLRLVLNSGPLTTPSPFTKLNSQKCNLSFMLSSPSLPWSRSPRPRALDCATYGESMTPVPASSPRNATKSVGLAVDGGPAACPRSFLIGRSVSSSVSLRYLFTCC